MSTWNVDFIKYLLHTHIYIYLYGRVSAAVEGKHEFD